jgi:ribosome-associated translation inhibitor RaiA
MFPTQKDPTINRFLFWGRGKKGWVAEGLLAALFVGLAFFILLYSWISTTPNLGHWRFLYYVSVTVIVMVVVVMTYTWVVRYRKRRFQHGKRDYLLMRNLMKTCLTKDCGQIETLLSTPDYSDTEIFNQMFLVQMLHILDHEGLRMRDIHARFEKSRLQRLDGARFEIFFDNVDAYNQRQLPEEFEAVFKAVDAFMPQLETQLFQLKTRRRDLFTSMSDFLDIMDVSQKEIEKLQQVYRYNPPKDGAAERIVFAIKTIDYLKKYHQDRLSDELRTAMQNIAAKKISKLKTALSDYRKSWKSLVKAYERLPLS